MEYRSLGRTGVKVSSLCLGCMNFGDRTDESDSMDIIDRAIEGGINFLDTANAYGRGTSEEIVGKALQRNGKRGRVVLATKVHGTMDPDDPNGKGNHRRHIIEQCEASLRRLQTDWIDLYQIHRPSADTPLDETLRALDDLIRAGKVRYVGTSTFPAWQVMESLWIAKELGLNRFVSEQPPYHPLERRIERELVPLCRTYGIAIIPWAPIAEGFFSGKYRRDQDERPQGRLKKKHKWNNRHFVPAAFDVLETMEKIAEKHGVQVAEATLAWNAGQPGITSPITGPRTMEQLESSLRAAEVQLDDEDREQVDAVAEPGDAITRYYSLPSDPGVRWV
ncbi:MAG: aldo/keto reductase [Phycisphaerae bacterium]